MAKVDKKHELLINFFETDEAINEIEYLVTNPIDSKSPQAVSFIKAFEFRRHNRVGELFSKHLRFSHPEELSIYSIIKIVSSFANLSTEEQVQLEKDSNPSLTPDALHLSTIDHRQTPLVSVIDFKAGRSVIKARNETIKKYEEGFILPLRQFGNCFAEVVIFGLDSKNYELYMSESKSSSLTEAFERMKNDPEVIEDVQMISEVNNLMERIDNLYREFPLYKKYRLEKEVTMVSTDGYFTDKINKMLEFLATRKNNNYCWDDVFKLDSYKNSKLRLILLLAEYYDLPPEDENLLTELKLIVKWLENPSDLGKHIKSVHRRLKNDLLSYRLLIESLENDNVKNVIHAFKELKSFLDKEYKDEVVTYSKDLMETNVQDVEEFRPDEPNIDKFNLGLRQCMDKIKDGQEKRFVHDNQCQQSFNFLLPTDGNQKELTSLREQYPDEDLNSIKFYFIVYKLRNTLDQIEKAQIKNVRLRCHNPEQTEELTRYFRDAPPGKYILRRSEDEDKDRKREGELQDFIEIIRQVTVENGGIPEIEVIKTIGNAKISSKCEFEKILLDCNNDPEILEHFCLNDVRDFQFKNEDKQHEQNSNFFLYREVITDGINYYIGRGKQKRLKAYGKYIETKSIKKYMLHAGVSKKAEKLSNEAGKKIVTIDDLKSEELTIDEVIGKNTADYGIRLIDTRTKVLNADCIGCQDVANAWKLKFRCLAGIKIQKVQTKLNKTCQEIYNSKVHDTCNEARYNIDERMNIIYSSPMAYIADSISTLFEGLLVKSNFNKADTIAFTYSRSTDTIMMKLPGEKLYNPKKTVPYIMIKKVSIDDLRTKQHIKLAIEIDYQNVDFLIKSDDCLYIVSKPQRLDLNRINTLSKCEMRFILASNVLYDTTMNNGYQKDLGEHVSDLLSSAFRLTATTSISQMSLRDPVKYLFTLAIADASDIGGFLNEKFDYHIKSMNDLALFYDLRGLLSDLIIHRKDIKEKNQTMKELQITEEGILEGGWPDFDIRSPFTGVTYRDIKQLVNEILINVYFVQKELHDHINNLEKLVKVPCQFELELKRHLIEKSEHDNLINQHVKHHGCDKTKCNLLLEECLDRFFFCQDTFSGTNKFSYNPRILMLSCRQRLKQESYKAELIRPKIEAEERIKMPIVKIETLTSSKSSTVCRDSKLPQSRVWNGNLSKVNIIADKDEQLLTRLKLERRRLKNIYDLDVVKQRVKLWSSVKSILTQKYGGHITEQQRHILIELAAIMDDLRNLFIKLKERKSDGKLVNFEAWKEKHIGLSKNHLISDKLSFTEYETFLKFTLEGWLQTETLPVKESLYELLEVLRSGKLTLTPDIINKLSVVDVCKLMLSIWCETGTTLEYCPVIRMFPKGQRTYVDREIYIMDIVTKILLYYIEHTYKHMNRINDFEAISLPGEAKTYFISTQEISFLVQNSTISIVEHGNGENKHLNHVNADESKWSARDVPLKFMDTHLVAISSKPSERLMLMCIQMHYMNKLINVPTEIMQRQTIFYSKRFFALDENKDKENPLKIMTKNFTRNYFPTTFNWLQGNFNYLSSFVHTGVMEFMKDVHKEYFTNLTKESSGITEYGRLTNFASMVHSDDGTISTFCILDDITNDIFLSFWKSYARFMFFITKSIKRRFAIELNPLKTFCSEAIKDFISEFLVNGEFIGNYARYIVNCCGDSNFRSFKEDISMLMSAPQQMSRRGSTLETLLIAVGIVNYHVYHTYSMAPQEINDPINAINDGLRLSKINDQVINDIKDERLTSFLKKLSLTNSHRMNLEPIDRNNIITAIGGYCNPPLHLLAILGAKAHDAYVLMDSFRAMMSLAQFNVLINNPTEANIMTVKLAIDAIKKSPNLLPPIHILISAFILRQEMGYINAKFSKFDMNRLNHINILTFPSSKREESLPIRFKSYNDFIQLVNKSQEFAEELNLLLKDSKNITGQCQDTDQFKLRIKLDYHLTRKIDVFQTLPTATQRLNRLITSNGLLFMPINLIDGLNKIKLSKSFQTYESDELGLIDSKISLVNSEIRSAESLNKKLNNLESDSLYNYADYIIETEKIKNLKIRYNELLEKREKLRREHEADLTVIREDITDIVYLISELSYKRNSRLNVTGKNYRCTINSEHYNAKGKDDSYTYSDMGNIEKERLNSPLRTKFSLKESILYISILGCAQSNETLIESYIYSLLATIFNDKMLNYYMKLDMATVKAPARGKPAAKLQKMVYPYQVRQLTYKAEDLVKYTLMPKEEQKRYIDEFNFDEPTFFTDLSMVQRIVIDLELTEVIEEIKQMNKIELNTNDENIEDNVIRAVTAIRRYSTIYNILLKTISIYFTKQAYILSRSQTVDVAYKFFASLKGNFVASEQYVEMIINQKILEELKLDVLTSHDSSIKSVKRVLDAVTSFIERCQRLLGAELTPVDASILLKNSYCGGENMWDYLVKNADIIGEFLTDFKGYIPILYHLGIISEYMIKEKIERPSVNAIWYTAHSARHVLKGEFDVEYRHKRMSIRISGYDTKIKNLTIRKDYRYVDTGQQRLNFGSTFSVIMARIQNDFKLPELALPLVKQRGMVYKRMTLYGKGEYFLVDEFQNRDWTRYEKMNCKLIFSVNKSNITELTDTVSIDEQPCVYFKYMADRYRKMTNLCVWDVKRLDSFKEVSDIDDRVQMSNLTQVEVELDQFLPNNMIHYVPLTFTEGFGDEAEQRIIFQNIRAKPERFAEVQLLKTINIQINGLDLKTLLESLREIEDSTLHISTFNSAHIKDLVPIVKPILGALENIVESGDIQLDEVEVISELMQIQLSETFDIPEEILILNSEGETFKLSDKIFRSVIASSTYDTLKVSILTRFPESKITLKSLMTTIVSSIIRDTSIFPGRDPVEMQHIAIESQIEAYKFIIENEVKVGLGLLMHTGNLTIHPSPVVQKNLPELRDFIKSRVGDMICIYYLLLIIDELEKSESYIMSKESMLELNNKCKMNMFILITTSLETYKGELPRELLAVPKGPWKSNVDVSRQEFTYTIITRGNFMTVKVGNASYANMLKNKLHSYVAKGLPMTIDQDIRISISLCINHIYLAYS